jgi:hypothetical protein
LLSDKQLDKDFTELMDKITLKMSSSTADVTAKLSATEVINFSSKFAEVQSLSVALDYDY